MESGIAINYPHLFLEIGEELKTYDKNGLIDLPAR